MTQRIGIFGGTFDPVHLGHVHAARAVQEEFVLDRVYFIPVYLPVHRELPGATPEQRIDMLNLAIATDESFITDNRETRRGGPSYSLLTVKEYRSEFADAELYFILGTDAFNNISSWYCWQELFNYVNFIVLARPEVSLQISSEGESFLTPKIPGEISDTNRALAGQIYISEHAMLDNSATEVRKAIDNDASLEALLDKKVLSYIKEHNIYRKDLLK